MLERLIDLLAGLIVATISSAGYGGIVLLMAIESACIPLPSEVIMPFSGYLVSTGRFDLALVATAGALGCNVGSTVAYVIGAYGGRRLVERYGALVLIGRRELALADWFFARWGGPAVFVARLLPVVRTFIALPAGIARMGQLRFQLYTFAGSWPWCYGLAYVGARLGERWNSDPALKQFFHRFDGLIVVLVLASAAWFVWTHLRHRSGDGEE
ncbi:MAG TPA: DedA family protein [Stellaceae bacterium]|nr:DedA family protein [Stellaceae bacterium]